MVRPKVRIDPKTGEAWSDADITGFLEAYRWIVCRSYGHAWNPPEGFYGTTVNGRQVFEKRIPCMRCPTQRVERIKLTRDGIEADSNAYVYPTGYQTEPGMALGRRDFRETKHRRELVSMQQIETMQNQQEARGA